MKVYVREGEREREKVYGDKMMKQYLKKKTKA